jgi:IS30 family transposase
VSSASQRKKFFAIMDRGSTIRGAAIEVGVTPDVGYRWVKKAGLAAQRATPRVYSDADKAEFFRLLAEQGNVSAVARQLGFVRVTCYKWAHQAGIFTGRSVDAQRDEFLKLRAGGLSRAEAAERVGTDKRSAHDWDRGIRQFYGGRVYPDGRVVSYPYAERIAKVKRPRTTYLVSDRAELEGLEQPISGRFLSLEEREQIHDLRNAGNSIRSIGRHLKRSASTISRELARNSTGELGYMPYGAHRRAARQRSRPRTRKLHASGPLRDYVVAGLAKRWSPEQVSHRMAKDFADDLEMRACTETIYQVIYADHPDALARQPKCSTRFGRTRRQPQRDPAHRTKRFVDPMTPIQDRPAEVEQRDEPGHWEGDLIVGTLHRSAIATVVDRASRFLLMVHLDADHNADTVSDGLITTMGPLPSSLRRTLTWDQGAEMSEHRRTAKATGLDVYFCDAGSPWQRGTNENTNGLLRQYFPKGTDLAAHTRGDLDAVAAELNNRPRKSLDWDTPTERLEALLTSQ